MKTSFTPLSKVLILLSSLMLITSLFVPIWRIELEAPQYPEGLTLLMYPNKIAGDVDVINGLNHYIGMQTIHSENFIEFTILPYIIITFSILFLVTMLVNSFKLLLTSILSFTLFGIVSLIDFWRWNYNYGHNLDPNAAIKVPGMTYEPPVIGFKQLLNFGAYSIPDIGGWIFMASALLLIFVLIHERQDNLLSYLTKSTDQGVKSVLIICSIFFTYSCELSETQPQKININVDKCDHCKMTIADSRFASELQTKKGRIYKFDDVSCLVKYIKANTSVEFSNFWVPDFNQPNNLLKASTMFYVQSEEINSPMGGNTACFRTSEEAKKYALHVNGEIISWDKIDEKI